MIPSAVLHISDIITNVACCCRLLIIEGEACMSSWQAVVKAHVTTDSYCDGHVAPRRLWWSRPLQYGIQTFLCGYLAVACLRPNHYHHSTRGAAAGLLYESPEGLQMTLHDEFPSWFLQVHRWAGVVLVPLVVLQKHLVPSMAIWPRGSEERKASRSRWSSEAVRKSHVIIGYVALGAMGYMAVCGFFLRATSTFGGFQWAMVMFVAPWVVFLGALPYTVWREYRVAHAVIGSAVFKACVAVPLARTLGVVLQHFGTEATLARDYYLGIAAAAAAVGVWAIRDAWAMIRVFQGEKDSKST